MLIALAVLVIGGMIFYATWDNLRTAIPGQVYRSAQLSGSELKEVVRAYGIKSVVNLRPIREGSAWYPEEAAAMDGLGIEHHVVGLSQTTPRVDTFRALKDVLEDIETPVLFQCTSGVDRSGVATAMFMLLRGEWTLEEVGKQLGWRYGAFSENSTGKLLLAQYREWLAQNSKTHSPELFDDWLANHYVDPSGNFHFFIHPIRDQPWLRPWGLYEEGVEFEISRGDSPIFHVDGWAFDTDNEQPLADISFSLGAKPLVNSQYGLDSSWLIEDFGKEQYLQAGWAINQPLEDIPDGCHDLRITFERLDGESWQTPPAARICITP